MSSIKKLYIYTSNKVEEKTPYESIECFYTTLVLLVYYLGMTIKTINYKTKAEEHADPIYIHKKHNKHTHARTALTHMIVKQELIWVQKCNGKISCVYESMSELNNNFHVYSIHAFTYIL